MIIKFLLPRKLYYFITERDLNVGIGWTSFVKYPSEKDFRIVTAGYGFWETLIKLIKY